MEARVVHADCLAAMREMPDASVDSLVTDPPAGIGFMNKAWDHHKGGRAAWVAWMTEVMAEALRVLKPGAHGFVWALPRTSHWTATALEDAGFEMRDVITHHFSSGFPKSRSALKPASEHWLLVRKQGRGSLNIDASRIGTEQRVNPPASGGYSEGWGRGEPQQVTGRWPANVVLSHAHGCNGECAPDCAVAELERQSAGASRFFYVPKAPRSERQKIDGAAHPTIKALALMRYLVRMVTPPGGVVLDPFAGSGATLEAARDLGLGFVGIEADESYVRLIEHRLLVRS